MLTEGLIPYLDDTEVGALADELRALPGVEGWIADYISPESHAYRERSGLTRALGNAPFRFRPGDWFGFFAIHGWRPREVRYLPEEGIRLGRTAPLPRRMRWMLRSLGRSRRLTCGSVSRAPAGTRRCRRPARRWVRLPPRCGSRR